MEVKVIKKLDNLSQIFLVLDSNEISLTERYINCADYSSKSGLTSEGCLEINLKNVSDVREVKGIYYVPVEPIINVSFRKKFIIDHNDVINILQSIDLQNMLNKMGINVNKLLVKWNNYAVYVFDKFMKECKKV